MQYRVIPYLSNNNMPANDSKASMKSGKEIKSHESLYRIDASDGLDCSNISKDKIQTFQNKSKCNPSISVSKKIKNTSMYPNQSFVYDHILNSKQSIHSNINHLNPEDQILISKERAKYRSKTYQGRKQSKICSSNTKIQTRKQKAKHKNSLYTNEHYKTVNFNLRPSSFYVQKVQKSLSKKNPIKYESKQKWSSVQNQVSSIRFPKTQHLQFYSKLSNLTSRNQEINVKYRQVESNFDRFNQEMKISLQKQLKDIQNLRQTMIKQYEQRAIKINVRTKFNQSKTKPQKQNFPTDQNRISTSNNSISLIVE